MKNWRIAALYGCYAAGLLVFAVLLLTTTTLNADDLQIAEWAPAALKAGWLETVRTTLFNLDFGKTQVRTYGLARAFQYVQVGWLGSAPVTIYGILLLLHCSSGYLVFRLVVRMVDDSLIGLFGAVAWVASPAALPMLKVEHLFLYLIAPYYALLAWLALSLRERDGSMSWFAGTAALSVAWLLGEGVIAPIFVVVAVTAAGAGSLRKAAWLVSQGLVAGGLLCAYLGYQYWFVRNPLLPQRFHLAPDASQLSTFVLQLVQNGRAVIGLSYRDAELGSIVGGVSALGSWIFLTAASVFLLAGLAGSRDPNPSPPVVNRNAILTITGMWLSSVVVYCLFSLAGVGVFAVRYSAGFFALAPLACLMAVAAVSPRVTSRRFGAVVAAASLALSVSLLWRAEVLVNRPNRALLQALSGRAVVLRPEQPFDLDPAMFGATSGLVGITTNGLANPMRSLWTSELALRQFASATLGTECRRLPDGRGELLILGQSRGIFPIGKFAIVDSTWTPEQACGQP